MARTCRFTFDIPARYALHILESLPSTKTSYVRNLAFGTYSTDTHDDNNDIDDWEPLWQLIGDEMSVNTATFQMTHNTSHEVDWSQSGRKRTNGDGLWLVDYAVPGVFRDIVLDGKIQKLLLAYGVTYKRTRIVEHDEGDFEAIDRLRYLCPDRELQSDEEERMELEEAISEGLLHKSPSLEAFGRDQMTRRLRIDFPVHQEDNPEGDLGTVLITTRPGEK